MREQKGMTLIGMLFIVAVVVMAAIVIMRVIPVYLQHYYIVQSVKSLNEVEADSLSGDAFADIAVLKSALDKRFIINGIDTINAQDIVITPTDENHFKVLLKYQAVRSLVYNVSLLFEFNNTYEVVISSEK